MHAEQSTVWAPTAGDVLAATKLRAPALRRGLVPREALVRTLHDAPPTRLTLVSAPAGWGKTTLVTQWQAAEAEQRPFAWLSLDVEDNDPVRFWDCVMASVAEVAPGVGARALAALRAPGTSLVGVVLPLLINDLAARSASLVLVLDDLHVIADPEIHRSLAYFLDRAPDGVHVAVTTRADPPLPLARLRARGQLVEVRASELRFSDAEAGAMLTGLGLDLPAIELAELQARTEGWAAGLQLAALSLRGRTEPEDRLAVLRAGGPHVVEFLTQEVLDGLPAETRGWLLHTSVLERLGGSLCDAVVERTGSAERLEALCAAGLFITALDARGEWYRVHPLLREVLLRRLAREDPAAVTALHERASAWFAHRDLPADAIRHALATGTSLGAELVATYWTTFFNRGELASVSAWLAQLPPAVVEGDARLWLARAWIALDHGRLEEVEDLLAVADEAATPGHAAWAPLLRAVHAFKRGDLAAAATGVERARRSPEPSSAFWRAVAAVVSGATAYWLGRDAHRELEDALRTARADDNRLAELYALGYLSLADAEEGDRGSAVERLREAGALTDADPGLDEHFVACAAHLARAAEDQRRGERAAAAAAGERALELARRGAGALEVAEALRVVALTRLRLGRTAEARRALHEARAIADACAAPGRLAARLTAAAAELEDDGRDLREPLSDRELAVLRLLPTELSQREIGGELYVSVNTVKTHVKNIFFKLRVGSREEAVGRARELGLL